MKTLTKIVMFFVLVAMFNGCGGGGSSSGTTPTNKVPTANQALVTKNVVEASTLSYDLTSNTSDADGDSLSVTSLVQSDGSALPSGVTLVGNELKVADTISVNDGQNLTYDLNATISDGEDNVTYQVRVVIQDRSNDSLMTYTLNIPDTDSNATLNGWVKLEDSDGLSNTGISFELLDRNDSNNSVYTAMMTDVGNDGNYTFSIDLQAQSVDASHYTFKTSAISPVIGGENPQSDVVISHNFEVRNLAPTWTATSYNTGLTINDSSDAEQTIQDLTAISSDVDGDTITYSIVSIDVPAEQIEWNNSIYLDNGILKVQNLQTNDPDTSGTVTVRVKATAIGGANDTNVSFTFNNVN
jgi:hypothetical protein